MELLKYHRDQFKYGNWANAEVQRGLIAISSPPLRACSIMAHIVGAEWLWLCRVLGKPARLAVWPDLDLESGVTELRMAQERWAEVLTADSPSLLSKKVHYVNSRGKAWANHLSDILTHVVVHSAYHRGQIALLLRQDGIDPAYTDYIHAVREGKINA